MKASVVIFPGSNCDDDCVYVSENILGADTVRVWHTEGSLPDTDLVILPGGFSYGDYLRAGAIANFSPIMKDVVNFANKGGLVFGICNGFQILLESGLLKGAMQINKNIHFICKYIHLKPGSHDTPFTNQIPENKVIQVPIAHKEGNYHASDDVYKELQDNNQIAFTYCNKDGIVAPEYNPNGSRGNIAGIYNKNGNVLGMMPHPERSSEPQMGSDDGKLIFDSIRNWINNR